MDAGEIISLILKGYKERNRNMPSFVGNDSNTSFYISMKRGKDKCPVQIRLSNHGTYLRTWVDRTNLENSNERLQDPSHCINISIVFIDDGKDLTNDCEGQTNCDNCQITPCIPQTFDGQNDLGHPFQVQQYTYCSRTIRKRYLKGIVGAIIRALRTGKYTDPLSKVTKRKAANKTLDSSYPITPQNNKTDKNESKNMNRKNTIRLTESELKNIITESVKNILKEDIAQYSTIPYEVQRNELVDDIVYAIDNIIRTLPELSEMNYSDNNTAQFIIKKAHSMLNQVSAEIEKLHEMVVETN